VRVPVIELVEIGAGGGSIGRVDALQRITVGPDSAGADPGPACYGRGGTAPTVTDANLVLGRIEGRRFAAGRMALDEAAALRALHTAIGQPLQLDGFWSAAGLSEIVEENMANAARVHAVERGKSLRDCTMIAFGGAAPLHAARLATKLGVRHVLVPAGAGVGSAIGFLRAPMAFEVVRSTHGALAQIDLVECNSRLQAMQAEAEGVVLPAAQAAGQGVDSLRVERLAELRYVGQGHELRVALPVGPLAPASVQQLQAAFEAAYESSYGLRIPGAEVEVVTWSITVATRSAPVQTAVTPSPAVAVAPHGQRPVWDPTCGKRIDFSMYWRFDLPPGATLAGPALVMEHETTTVVPPGWLAHVDSLNHLHLDAPGALA
jgi:N-methylhydantoinase A